MKYLLFSDLHFGISGASNVWLDASIVLAHEIIDRCKEENIDNILFLGDFFNDRRAQNSKVLWKAIEFANVFEENKINLFLIIGNHDLYLKNAIEPHSLRIFDRYEYIHVIDKLTKLNEFVTLVPWGIDWKQSETAYIFGHLEINGFEVSASDNMFENNVSDFSRYTKVFSGHFHTRKTIRNIEYIGSVMPFTFHDVDSIRGYTILDIKSDKNFDEDFIEFKSCPKFKIIYSNKEFTRDDILGNVIKLVYVDELSTISNEDLLTKIQDFSPISIQTDFKNIIQLEDENIENDNKDITNIKSSIDLLEEYIKKTTILPEHINKNVLKMY